MLLSEVSLTGKMQVVILVIVMTFAFTAYATNVNLGSPAKVYDLLVEAARAHPVEGNEQGSYLTMRSKEGAIFFVINIGECLCTASSPQPLVLVSTLCYLSEY